MLTKDFVKKEAKQVKPPLLMHGEDSSPRCTSAEIARQNGDGATISVRLVDDITIGYFRDGEYIDYTNKGAKIELVKDNPHLPDPETEIFHWEGYSDEIVGPFRDKKGKITRQGLKELGAMAALDYLVNRDLTDGYI